MTGWDRLNGKGSWYKSQGIGIRTEVFLMARG